MQHCKIGKKKCILIMLKLNHTLLINLEIKKTIMPNKRW